MTGGASLIESAKTRSLINEIKNIERAYYSFCVIKGRIPGDLDENGMHGYKPQYAPDDIEKQPYLSSDFSAPYDGTVEGYGIPNQITSPFVELYLEKIFDFKPRNVSSTDLEVLYKSGGLPPVKSISGYYFLPIYRVRACDYKGDFRCNIVPSNYIEAVTELGSNGDFKMARILKSIDKKIDDGAYNDGDFISECNYDESLQEKKGCRAFDYKIAIKCLIPPLNGGMLYLFSKKLCSIFNFSIMVCSRVLLLQ